MLVVGASATGVQLADELAGVGRQVTLAVGGHTPPAPRYRGSDIWWWLEQIGTFDRTIDEIPDPVAARHEPSLQLVGRPDHRNVDVTTLAAGDTMTNTLSLEESTQYYERYAIPAAGPIFFEGAMAELNPRTASRVDFHRTDRAPLLFVGFGRDNVVPASVSKAIARTYEKSTAVTEYIEFPERPHFPGVPGWEDVADQVLAWAKANARTPS